ncbi:hypothetical protein L6R52_34430 [Myxococcota bacterium]|nr:hypothetical protein [Myxococcota bacterium]
MRVLSISLISLTLAACSPDATVEPPDPPAGGDASVPVTTPVDRARVFFVGHSLVNHDMPEMLADVAESLGRDHAYDVQVKNGTPLRVQWDEETPGEGRFVAGSGTYAPSRARTTVPSGDFDVMVMTELGPISTFVQWGCTAAYALEFYNLAVRANPATRVYYYETWRQQPEDWATLIPADRATIDQWVVDQVNTPRAPPARPTAQGNCPHPNPPSTREPGTVMRVVPAGRAMSMLDEAIRAGTVPGVTSRSQLFEDQIHLTDLGNYFVSLVMYATIYAQSPVGGAHATTKENGQAFDAISAETAARLQEIAWDAVRGDPRSGVD